jgi:hypothetical protein
MSQLRAESRSRHGLTSGSAFLLRAKHSGGPLTARPRRPATTSPEAAHKSRIPEAALSGEFTKCYCGRQFLPWNSNPTNRPVLQPNPYKGKFGAVRLGDFACPVCVLARSRDWPKGPGELAAIGAALEAIDEQPWLNPLLLGWWKRD